MKNFTYVFGILWLVIVATSCDSNEENHAIGTVIGNYSNGFSSLLLQVDEEYPIGKTIEYTSKNCETLPEDGIYRNIIQVQAFTKELTFSEIENKKISFSYRPYQDGKDNNLFIAGSGVIHGNCVAPDVPVYVITGYQVLN